MADLATRGPEYFDALYRSEDPFGYRAEFLTQSGQLFAKLDRAGAAQVASALPR